MRECTWGTGCTYDSECGPGTCNGGVCDCPNDCPGNPCGDGILTAAIEQCDD